MRLPRSSRMGRLFLLGLCSAYGTWLGLVFRWVGVRSRDPVLLRPLMGRCAPIARQATRSCSPFRSFEVP